MPKTLAEKIDSLPPDKQARVEEFVDRLASEPDLARHERLGQIIERVRVRRESQLRERGLLDSSEIFRELREEGP